jgi:hypothetical protein
MTKLKSLQSPNRLAVNHAAEIEDLAAKSLKFRSQKLHVKPANVTEDVEQVKIFDVFNKNKFQAAASPSASHAKIPVTLKQNAEAVECVANNFWLFWSIQKLPVQFVKNNWLIINTMLSW